MPTDPDQTLDDHMTEDESDFALLRGLLSLDTATRTLHTARGRDEIARSERAVKRALSDIDNARMRFRAAVAPVEVPS